MLSGIDGIDGDFFKNEYTNTRRDPTDLFPELLYKLGLNYTMTDKLFDDDINTFGCYSEYEFKIEGKPPKTLPGRGG